MSDSDFAQRLAAFCADRFGDKGDPTGLQRLSGGANMESWAFAYGGRGMVMRRLPAGMEERGEEAGSVAAISLATQADLIELAREHGITAPEVLARLEEKDGLGTGFVMAKAEGETLPPKILGNPDFARAEALLAEQCAAELAAIHAIPLSAAPDEIQAIDAEPLLNEQERAYREIGGAIPAYEYAFRWLEETLPSRAAPRLLHGDFRMGNLVIDRAGISAVLDWELTHTGDPLQDLAYLCTPSWRFGHYEKEAGGFAGADELIGAYEKASGAEVHRDNFDWWLVYNTLWWGVACLRMGHSYRDGTAHTLERTIIGRRASEVEIDLLLLFEPMREGESRALAWPEPALLPKNGEVAYAEILNALIEWNKEKVMPGRKGHTLFEARVANNALGIAQRAAAWGGRFAERAAARLDGIDETHASLCTALRQGEAGIDDPQLWDHLRLSALERLAIDQPKYGGFRMAKERWATE